MIPSALTTGWYRMRWSTWDITVLIYHNGTEPVFRHPSGAVHAVSEFPTATWTPEKSPSHIAAATPETVAPLQPAARVGSHAAARVLSHDGKPEGVVTGSTIIAGALLVIGLLLLLFTDSDPMLVMVIMMAGLQAVLAFELRETFRASAPVMGSREAATSSADARIHLQSSPTPGANPIR